jgi:broad-specificity NMP kinase
MHLIMETTIRRRPTSFRLRTDLVERLKRKAARENRTLNNYVESVLLDIVYDEPNEVTKTAIQEAMSGRNRNKVYSNVDEMFNDILNEE